MPDVALTSVSAFAALREGRPAAKNGIGVTVAERTGLGIATLVARKGQARALAETLRTAYGVELRAGRKLSRADGTNFAGVGPESWLVFRDGGGPGFACALARTVGSRGSVCDQSSGYGVLRLSGPRISETLAKGIPVDLHPGAFGLDDVAVTLASHVGTVIWQVDDAPTYDVAVFRSYAASFAHWLTASAAEFGWAFAR